MTQNFKSFVNVVIFLSKLYVGNLLLIFVNLQHILVVVQVSFLLV